MVDGKKGASPQADPQTPLPVPPESQQDYLQALLGGAADGIFVVDALGRFEWGNRAFSKILGWGEGELIGQPFLKVVPEDQHELILARWEEVQKGDGRPYEVDIVTREGERRHLAVSHTNLEYQGEPKYCVVVRESKPDDKIRAALSVAKAQLESQLRSKDDEIHQFEERLVHEIANSESLQRDLIKLSFAIESSPVSVIITDRHGGIEYINPTFCEMVGYTREEVRGKNVRILKSGYHPPEFYKEMWQELGAGRKWRGEVLNRRKSGELMWNLATICPVRNDKGQTLSFVAIHEDITEAKKLMHEQQVLQDRLDRYERMATIGQVVSSTAHCLKNLMTVFNGGVHMLRQGVHSGEHQHLGAAHDLLEKTCTRMGLILHDMLDYSKVRQPNKSRFSVVELFDRIYSSIESAAHETEVRLQFKADDEAAEVFLDPIWMERILLNLALNAIDAMPKGGELFISARKIEECPVEQDNGRVTFSPYPCLTSGGTRIVFEVRDTGDGIMEDDISQIFNPFFSTKGGHGTGLGLASVEQYVMGLGGCIFVSTALGEGTTFRLCFPAE